MLAAGLQIRGTWTELVDRLGELREEGRRARHLAGAARFFFWIVLVLAIFSVLPGMAMIRRWILLPLVPSLFGRVLPMAAPWPRMLDGLLFAAIAFFAGRKLAGSARSGWWFTPWVATWAGLAATFVAWGFAKGPFLRRWIDWVSFIGLPPFWLFGLADLLILVPVLLALRELRRCCLEDWAVVEERIDGVALLLEMLRDDLDGTVPVTIDIDPRPVYARDKCETAEGRTRGVDPWLRLDAKLADGNVLSLRLRLSMSRKEKAKRKYVKISEVWTESALLSLRVDGTRWPSPVVPPKLVGTSLGVEDGAVPRIEAVAEEAGRLRLRAGTERVRRTRGRGSNHPGIGRTPLAFDGATMLRLLSAAYACLGTNRLPPRVARRLESKGRNG